MLPFTNIKVWLLTNNASVWYGNAWWTTKIRSKHNDTAASNSGINLVSIPTLTSMIFDFNIAVLLQFLLYNYGLSFPCDAMMSLLSVRRNMLRKYQNTTHSMYMYFSIKTYAKGAKSAKQTVLTNCWTLVLNPTFTCMYCLLFIY